MQKRTATKQHPRKSQDVRKDFPLYAHGNGQWCKTIRRNEHDFGPRDEVVFTGGGVSLPTRVFASRPEATPEYHCGGKGAEPVGKAQ